MRGFCVPQYFYATPKNNEIIFTLEKKNHPGAKTCDKNTQWVKLICAKQERHTQEDR
jgi:hypothetical protein